MATVHVGSWIPAIIGIAAFGTPAYLLGTRYGWPGYVFGPLVGYLGLQALGGIVNFTEAVLVRGLPEKPACTDRQCRWLYPRPMYERGYRLHKCSCGRAFVYGESSAFTAVELFEVASSGEVKPHMRWRPLRGWTSNGPFRTKPSRID